MAVNINSVYQKVLALSNKEQRGYITPQEFNLLADMAQNEIFENYFHQARNSSIKIKDDDNPMDILESIEDKLHPFYKQHLNVTITGGALNLLNPVAGVNTGEDIYKIIDIGVYDGSVFIPAVKVSAKEYNSISANTKSVLYPTSSRPIYYVSAKNDPSPFGTPNHVARIVPAPSDSTIVSVHYYRQPLTPNWAYVVVNEKALYNSNVSVDFELSASEEEHLVSRILLLAGGAIKQPDLSQGAASLLQQKNQEQNS
tara:strand:- start:270 stop:1037 length:768 start_codon:yes stop_codon:yes gene_type:complete